MLIMRRIISTTQTIGATALILILGATVVRAQFVPLFGNQAPLLNGADFDLANAAARKLLEPQPAAMGTIADWKDSASGNSGTLTMGRTFQKDGHDCRTVSWHDLFKDGEERNLLLDTCRVSGVWRLM